MPISPPAGRHSPSVKKRREDPPFDHLPFARVDGGQSILLAVNPADT